MSKFYRDDFLNDNQKKQVHDLYSKLANPHADRIETTRNITVMDILLVSILTAKHNDEPNLGRDTLGVLLKGGDLFNKKSSELSEMILELKHRYKKCEFERADDLTLEIQSKFVQLSMLALRISTSSFYGYDAKERGVDGILKALLDKSFVQANHTVQAKPSLSEDALDG